MTFQEWVARCVDNSLFVRRLLAALEHRQTSSLQCRCGHSATTHNGWRGQFFCRNEGCGCLEYDR